MTDRYELEQRLDKAEWVLTNAGFRRCDIAACNCGSWHQVGGFKARFDEIKEAVEEADYSTNGKTLLDVVKEVITDAKRTGDDAQGSQLSAAIKHLEGLHRVETNKLNQIELDDDLERQGGKVAGISTAIMEIKALACQPSPAATVETDALHDSRNPNHGRTGGLRDPAPERCSAGIDGAEEAIRDWWYSERREPMTSKDAAKSLIWYLAKCGLKIAREPQPGDWINEPLRNWTVSTDEPQEVSSRELLECAQQAIEYSIEMGCSDPGGVLLQTLNKLDTALAVSRPQSRTGEA